MIVGSGLEGFLSLSALLKPEIAAVFSAVVAGQYSIAVLHDSFYLQAANLCV